MGTDRMLSSGDRVRRRFLLCSQLSWIAIFGCGDSSSPVTPESVGTVEPVEPVENDPMISGGAPAVLGGDNALRFDGVDDRVTVPYDTSFPTEVFTVAAWIKLAPPPGRASCEGTGVPSSNNFQVLSIGCTFGTIGPPPGGREPPVWFFPGFIDSPAVWSIALSASDIESVFDSGVNPGSTGLVGYWSLDEGSGQFVSDLSSFGIDGFLGESSSTDGADPQWRARTSE